MTKIDKYTQLFWKCFAWGILALLVWGLSGCYTQRTAERQTDKAHHKYPLVVAKKCAETYPCKDSVHYQTEYIQGDAVMFVDTVTEVYSTIDTVTIVKYLTKTIERIDTVRDVKYIQQTDKAKEAVLKGENEQLKKDLIIMTDSRDDWRLWAIILGSIIALWLVWKLAKGYVSKWIKLGK